jgi:hypothetical protein
MQTTQDSHSSIITCDESSCVLNPRRTENIQVDLRIYRVSQKPPIWYLSKIKIKITQSVTMYAQLHWQGKSQIEHGEASSDMVHRVGGKRSPKLTWFRWTKDIEVYLCKKTLAKEHHELWFLADLPISMLVNVRGGGVQTISLWLHFAPAKIRHKTPSVIIYKHVGSLHS